MMKQMNFLPNHTSLKEEAPFIYGAIRIMRNKNKHCFGQVLFMLLLNSHISVRNTCCRYFCDVVV